MEITDGQKVAIKILLNNCGVNESTHKKVLSLMLDKTISSYDDLVYSDWCKIRKLAYPNWKDTDWTVGKKFKGKVTEIIDNILGQEKLF